MERAGCDHQLEDVGDYLAYLLDQMGGKGNLIFLRMAEHHGHPQARRCHGDGAEGISRCEGAAEHNIDYTAFFEDNASKTMEDYVARFGKEINAVWAPLDEPAQAAVNVLNAAGLKDVKVIGIDGHPQAVAEARKPDSQMIATVSQPFEKDGRAGGRVDPGHRRGQEKPDDVLPSKTVYMDAPLITKKELQGLHVIKYAGAAGPPRHLPADRERRMEIVLSDITMQFPGTRALDGVTADFRTDEVHGLIGENGAESPRWSISWAAACNPAPARCGSTGRRCG